MAKLKNTLNINGEDYEITAKEASKVTNSLTINRAPYTNTAASPVVEFDGSESQSIELVTAAGGKFKGHIRVPSADTNIDNKDNLSADKKDFKCDAVLNYGDIRNKVLSQLINNSALYKWSDTGEAFIAINTATGSINGISVACLKGRKSSMIKSLVNEEKNCR